MWHVFLRVINLNLWFALQLQAKSQRSLKTVFLLSHWRENTALHWLYTLRLCLNIHNMWQYSKARAGQRSDSTDHPACLTAGCFSTFLWGCLGLKAHSGEVLSAIAWISSSPFLLTWIFLLFHQRKLNWFTQEAYVCLEKSHSPFVETLQITYLALQRRNRRLECLLQRKENTRCSQNGSISSFLNLAQAAVIILLWDKLKLP